MAIDELQSNLFRTVCERNRAQRRAEVEAAERRIIAAAEAMHKREMERATEFQQFQPK